MSYQSPSVNGAHDFPGSPAADALAAASSRLKPAIRQVAMVERGEVTETILEVDDIKERRAASHCATLYYPRPCLRIRGSNPALESFGDGFVTR